MRSLSFGFAVWIAYLLGTDVTIFVYNIHFSYMHSLQYHALVESHDA